MTKITGHRGARNLWPENGLTGFRNVIALDVDAIEFDVHLTDQGELIVIHDATLDRTTEGQGPVRLLTPETRRTTKLMGAEISRASRTTHMPLEAPRPRGARPL